MKYAAGGFKVTFEQEAIDFMKRLIKIMKEISVEEITQRNVMSFVGISNCLEDLNDFTSQDAEHYRAVLIELINNYQSKLEGGNR